MTGHGLRHGADSLVDAFFRMINYSDKYLLQTKIQYNNGNTFLENGTNLFKEATPWKLEIED